MASIINMHASNYVSQEKVVTRILVTKISNAHNWNFLELQNPLQWNWRRDEKLHVSNPYKMIDLHQLFLSHRNIILRTVL